MYNFSSGEYRKTASTTPSMMNISGKNKTSQGLFMKNLFDPTKKSLRFELTKKTIEHATKNPITPCDTTGSHITKPKKNNPMNEPIA